MPARAASGASPDGIVDASLLREQRAFLRAIDLYESVLFYKRAGIAVSVANVSLQAWLVLFGMRGWSGILPEIAAFVAAVAWTLPVAMSWGSAFAHFLVWVGILSSWAEVSHYMCHTTRYRIQGFLERIGLVLSRRNHSRHHAEDNVEYAFLNSWTNPVLNVLARLVSTGYKTTTDLHAALYKAAARS